ncbi:Tat (twin-arginine translocation) pathway signal sequence [Paenibacillus sp. yr247]|uniref:DUF1501 domain-containing protein n=1 Tax=Paenibacillus sp. yr247 TaxID=1761880 RepID=UPI00087F8625|nr:DUF1501 domain-containing protein [Paenibacillus sp. yr247]SDN32080.1 Tat (twin-arginine translocation) pathway signal sequence [Paenibacillus sp. yr247]
MKLTRRDFLKKSTALIATLSFGGTMLATEKGRALLSGHAEFKHRVKSPVLVVVQLSGGNDGINTVIPYAAGAYYDTRPTLGYKQNEVLALNNELGLHPSLSHMQQFYRDGNLAIIQGVGYPKPDRSHFRSMDIWQTAKPEELSDSGWLARYILTSMPKHPLPAIQIGGLIQKAFNAPRINIPAIESLEQFYAFTSKTSANDKERMTLELKKIYQNQPKQEMLRVSAKYASAAFQSVESIHSLLSSYKSQLTYPQSGFASDLQLVAKLIAAKAGTRIYYTDMGGFDDHANERKQHANKLKQLDEGLYAFYSDLKDQGLHHDVVTLVFSEFGRRLKENGSGGTDHGTAAPVLVLGGQVKGGLFGAYPSLTNLDYGDLKYEVDFRSVYYTLIEGWLRGDAKTVLGGKFEKLGFV